MESYQQSVGEPQDTERVNEATVRRGAAAAIIGGVIGIVISSLMSAAYHQTADGATDTIAPWEPALLDLAAPLLTFGTPDAVYTIYGMVAGAVFLGLLLGVIGYRAYLRSVRVNGTASGRERWGITLAMGGLLLSVAGNIGDYWLGQPELVDFAGFLVGTLGGFIVVAIGFALLGYEAWYTGSLSRLSAAMFLLWLPVTIGVMALALDNIPGGALLPLGILSITLGYDLWTTGE